MARTSTPWALLLDELGKAGRIDLERVSVDSFSLRAVKGGDLTGANPVDRSKAGSRLHVAGEASGRRRWRPAQVHADKACDHRRCRAYLRRRGIRPRIARRMIASSTCFNALQQPPWCGVGDGSIGIAARPIGVWPRHTPLRPPGCP
jgi:hypothetical protein